MRWHELSLPLTFRECVKVEGMAAKCFREMTQCRTTHANFVGQNEGGQKEMGCDNASFMKFKAAVMEAISLFAGVDVSEIMCVDNAVQVGSLQPPCQKSHDFRASV